MTTAAQRQELALALDHPIKEAEQRLSEIRHGRAAYAVVDGVNLADALIDKWRQRLQLLNTVRDVILEGTDAEPTRGS